MGHLAPLMMGRDPFDIERNWDIAFRVMESYGTEGVTMNAISGFDNACWDIIGKALGEPVWRLWAARPSRASPLIAPATISSSMSSSATSAQTGDAGRPIRGEEGKRENVQLVSARAKRSARRRCDAGLLDVVGRDVHDRDVQAPGALSRQWVEEVLPPYEFAGYGRLRRKITSTNIATGEHVYGRYGFRKLLDADGRFDLAAGCDLVRRH
jgi:L-rhamnonate dehydratase